MSPIPQILTLARIYGEAVGVEPVTVSWRAFKDSKKLRALEDGASITVKRVETVIAWFSGNWPKGAAWPVDIPRPPSSSPPPDSSRTASSLHAAVVKSGEAA